MTAVTAVAREYYTPKSKARQRWRFLRYATREAVSNAHEIRASIPLSGTSLHLVRRQLVAEDTLTLVSPKVDQHLSGSHVDLALDGPRATSLSDGRLWCQQDTLYIRAPPAY